MINAIVRTKKSDLMNEKDFYQTYPGCTYALLDVLKSIGFSSGLATLDPCCGKESITRILKEYFTDVEAIDKFEGDTRQDFLEYSGEKDLIVMNPPYSNKYEFINYARSIARNVLCLLPLNTSNYNMFHREYEDDPEFVGKIQMAPKIFLHDGLEFKPGGTTQYAWYYWKRGNDTETSLTWYRDLKKIKPLHNQQNKR